MKDYSRELYDLSCRIWDYAELKFEETRSAEAMGDREPSCFSAAREKKAVPERPIWREAVSLTGSPRL